MQRGTLRQIGGQTKITPEIWKGGVSTMKVSKYVAVTGNSVGSLIAIGQVS